ncbi:High-affinity glucose transporter rgt2 [Phlyctochytrium planicorne]|nr:High-affinity glucose transporter rgt2 [Phlyctochytrium planicorne]
MSQSHNTYTWVVAFAAGMGGLLFGYEIGVIGQVLGFSNFQSDFNTKGKISNGTEMLGADGKPNGTFFEIDNPDKESREAIITSTFLFGCIGGALVCSFMADALGRKYSIIVGGALFAIGGLLQAIASSLGSLLGGRVISGLAIGVLSMVVPLYIAEAAPPQIRGRLTTVYQLLITFGIFIANCINAAIYVSKDKDSSTMWRTALGMQVLPASLLVVAVFFIPLSPRWLAEKGRHEEAQAVIAKLRSKDVNDSDVVAEYDGIRHGVEFERRIGTASWSELGKPGIARRVVIAVLNQTFQQLTGINVILYYSNTIFLNMGFKDAGNDFNSIVSFPIANAFINFVATFPGMWAVERFGRKPLLVYGGFVMGIAHALVFAFITGSNNGNTGLSWGAIFAIYLFLFAFASTWGPVVWSYQAEIFPLRIRAKGTGIATMTNWTWNAIIAYGFPIVFKALNKQPTVYWIFASFGFAMGLWAFVGVPETRGKTLEEMDELFGSAPASGAVEIDAEKK